jgi:protein-disulfide isomerase
VGPQIDKEYVQTGKVRWVFRNFAFLSQDSYNAAEASYCAQEQGKFWPLHDILFSNQGAESGSTFSMDNLKRFAKQSGLEESAFNACLDSRKYKDQVTKDNQYAQAQGVQGTPTFFMNGRAINVMDRDPQATINNLRRELDAELKK